MAAGLRVKCDAYLTPGDDHHLDLAAYDSNALLARPGQHQLGRMMSELAFAGWLWDDARCADLAQRILLRRAREAFATDPGPNPDASHHRSPLGIGITGPDLAWSADLLAPRLSDSEWADVVAHVRAYYLEYARRPFFELARLKSVGFNKTLKGMCAVGQLTLLVAEDLSEEELAWGLNQSLRSAFGYLREGMDDDGGTYEGPGYGAHCAGHITAFAECLRHHGLAALSQYEPLTRHGRWLASLLIPGGGTVLLGDSHGEEAGTIDLWAFGHELLHDPGYGFSAADAHSTVGVSALFGARVCRFVDGHTAAACTVDMAQMLDCRWAFREVVLLRGQHPCLIVADDLNYRSDWSEYDWHWQVPPGATAELPADGGPATIRNAGAVLDIHCFTPAPDAFGQAYETQWYDERFQPASWCGKQTELRRLRMHLAGYSGQVLSVLVPRRADALPHEVTRLPCLNPGTAVRLSRSHGQTTVHFQPYSRSLQTENMTGTGRLAVVRERDNHADGCLLVDGYDLTWKGQRLIGPFDRATDVVVP